MIGQYANHSFAYVLIRYDTIQKRRTKVNFLYVYVLQNQLIIFEYCMIHYVPRNSGNWPLRHVTNFREL